MLIKWIVMDVDGVLTDGKITYTSSGEELKSFFAQDGLALAAARKVGKKLAIITGRTSPMVERRVQELKIDFLIMGSQNKSKALYDLIIKENIKTEEICYMGDDLNDLGALKLAGLAIVPANAVEDAKTLADYVTVKNGGAGAVREMIEFILKRENLWDAVVASYANEDYGQGQ